MNPSDFFSFKVIENLSPINVEREITLFDGIPLSSTTQNAIENKFGQPIFTYPLKVNNKNLKLHVYRFLLAGHKTELSIFTNKEIVFQFSYHFPGLNKQQKDGITKLIVSKFGYNSTLNRNQNYLECSKGNLLLFQEEEKEILCTVKRRDVDVLS